MAACKNQENADLIIKNATIYSVNEKFKIEESMAVKNGKIAAIGTNEHVTGQFHSDNIADYKGKYIYPGFYDAHCHFLGYGLTLQEVDLTGTRSVDEVIEKLQNFKDTHPDVQWLKGRGWDQNDWQKKKFPDKKDLDRVFPDIPVYLVRIDGHAAWVNQKALDKSGLRKNLEVEGGEIILDGDGEPTGILIDNAMNLVSVHIPLPDKDQLVKALVDAQEKCFAVGLTTVSDAGLSYEEVKLIDSLQHEGPLKMGIYAMLNPSKKNLEAFVKHGPYQTEKLNVRSIKLFSDGALGSRGALLLAPYKDAPHQKGLQLITEEKLLNVCNTAFENGYQVNTHCIGDGANRLVLDNYGKVLKGKNNRRWRIEHAQIVNPDDMDKFDQYSVVPSVQPTHCTSDMFWADERLGDKRIKYAYAYRELLNAAGYLALGSDFPVEHINPLYGFYAAVARKNLSGKPGEGFQMENALSREEALRGMTFWAAFSQFEENTKGSLETGKNADFVVLDQDIMKIDPDNIPGLKIESTFVDGEKVYEVPK